MATISRQNTIRRFISGFLCLTSLLLLGCGKGKGTVKGTIKKGDQPISIGRIVFLVGNENQSGSIKDGTYEVVGVPVGEAKVVIDSRKPSKPTEMDRGMLEKVPKELRQQKEDQMKNYEEGLKKWVKVPAKYADQNKTPLNFDVKRGDNEFNVKIEE
jgi:hypothetical protein